MLASDFRSKSTMLTAGILFRLSLEWGYLIFVNPYYEYAGFYLNPVVGKYTESWVLYTLMVVLAPHSLKRPSDYFIVFLLFGLMGPVLSFYALADKPREYLYIVILGYFLIDVFRRGRPLRMIALEHGPIIALILTFLGILIVSLWLVVSGGVNHFNLDLTAVYEYRNEVGALINLGMMGYLNTWAFKVFGPVLLTVGLWRKQYWMVFMAILLHVYWFGVSSHKAVLLYPALCLFVWYWFRTRRTLSVVPVAMMAVVLIALLSLVFFDQRYVSSLFVRRAFYVLADNTFDYYTFFSGEPWLLWSNSITSGFIDYPYELNPAKVVGEWRNTESHVNNTFLSTGYMHAGVFGIVLYSIVAGLLFRVIDSLPNQGLPNWVILSVLIVPSESLLLSADLTTALLTHGVGLAILILVLLQSSPHVRLQPIVEIKENASESR